MRFRNRSEDYVCSGIDKLVGNFMTYWPGKIKVTEKRIKSGKRERFLCSLQPPARTVSTSLSCSQNGRSARHSRIH